MPAQGEVPCLFRLAEGVKKRWPGQSGCSKVVQLMLWQSSFPLTHTSTHQSQFLSHCLASTNDMRHQRTSQSRSTAHNNSIHLTRTPHLSIYLKTLRNLLLQRERFFLEPATALATGGGNYCYYCPTFKLT